MQNSNDFLIIVAMGLDLCERQIGGENFINGKLNRLERPNVS